MKSDSGNISLTCGFCFDRMMPKDDLGLGPRNDQVWVCVGGVLHVLSVFHQIFENICLMFPRAAEYEKVHI